MAVAPLLALALLATNVEGGASASATTQLGSPTDASDTASVEPGLFLAGSLSLDINDPLEGVRIAYSPRFTLGNGEAPQLLHQATVAGRWRASASQILRLSEAITYGDQDFSPLAPASTGVFVPPPIDRLPAIEVAKVFTSASNLDYTCALSPFLQLNAGTSFSIGGGLGSEARAELPLQRTGVLTSSLAWRISKLDQFGLSVNGSLSAPNSTERAETAGASTSWNHVFTATTSGSLQLGAAYLHDDGPTNEQQLPLVPTGGASVIHREILQGRELLLSLSTGAAPAIDPLSGAAYLRGTLTGSASWSPSARVGLTLSASGAHGLGAGLEHDWGAQASVSASLKIPPTTSVSLGFRSAWLPPAESFGQISGYQWTVFSSVAWGDTHRF